MFSNPGLINFQIEKKLWFEKILVISRLVTHSTLVPLFLVNPVKNWNEIEKNKLLNVWNSNSRQLGFDYCLPKQCLKPPVSSTVFLPCLRNQITKLKRFLKSMSRNSNISFLKVVHVMFFFIIRLLDFVRSRYFARLSTRYYEYFYSLFYLNWFYKSVLH